MKEEISQQDLKEFYNKGILAFEKKNYDYAIEIFSQILLSKYDHLEARHYLHLSLKNKSAPSSFFTNIINSITSFLLTISAETALKKGDLSRALERLEKILAKNPNDTKTLKKIADIFYKKALFINAIQNLEEAKSINPKDIEILKKLGEIYLKKEDYRNAKANYEQALKINPNDTDVIKALKNLDALGTIKREFGN